MRPAHSYTLRRGIAEGGAVLETWAGDVVSSPQVEQEIREAAQQRMNRGRIPAGEMIT